jgi:hypothetical protein
MIKYIEPPPLRLSINKKEIIRTSSVITTHKTIKKITKYRYESQNLLYDSERN